MADHKILNFTGLERQLLDGISIGVAVIDASVDRILLANRALCRLTKYSSDELELESVCFSDLFHPEDRARVAPQLERLLRREINEYTVQKRCIRADGSLAWMRVTAAAISKEEESSQLLVRAVEEMADGGSPNWCVSAGSPRGGWQADFEVLPSLVCGHATGVLRAESEGSGLATLSHPHYVSKAIEFMKERWNRSCSVTEIAKYAGVSGRTLQRYFLSQGTSLKRFAKLVRLESARGMLMNSEPGQSVTAIAFLCGFSRHGNPARSSAKVGR